MRIRHHNAPKRHAVSERAEEEDLSPRQRNARLQERTAELGAERLEVKERLEELKQIDPADRTPKQRAEFGRLARRLDRITTEMVQLNYGLVRKFVKTFNTPRTTPDELAEFEQAASLGLMVAIDSYDPSRGKFGTWAWVRVVRETLASVRAVDHANLNMGDFEVQGKIRKAVRAWELEHGPDVTVDRDWVADRTGASRQQVDRVLDKFTLVSTSARLGTDSDSATVGDMLADDEQDIESTVLSQMSRDALERHGLPMLTSQELFVIVRRFGLDGEPVMNLNEIGDMLGLSRETIRQTQMRAQAKLQHPRVMKPMLQAQAG